MTDTPNPLTADEQIEKLRATLTAIREKSLNPDIQNAAWKALAATAAKP